jgi:hypothetical protein
MIRYEGSMLLIVSRFLDTSKNRVRELKARNSWDSYRNEPVSNEDRELISQIGGNMANLLAQLGCGSTRKAFDRFYSKITSGQPMTVEDYCVQAMDISDRFIDEMEETYLFHAPKDCAELWGRDDLMSPLARERFPESAQEIRFAGSSYCCSLWTASVFHSMRAAEAGLRQVYKELTGIEASTLDGMKDVIKDIKTAANQIDEQKKSSERSARSQHYSEIASTAALFKDAWRNHVAHARLVYDQPQAHLVLTATRHFFEKAAAPIST